jgi:hypothetical protein
MAWQLIYTSAPRLLEAGRSGFGTVARHRAIHPLLITILERDSQFDRAPGRVVLAHRILTVAGSRFHVLTCIRDAGADYTGRTNHIAHHLIIEPREIAALASAAPTPADVLAQMEWRAAWPEPPRWLDGADEITLARFHHSPGAVSAWQAVTGEARRSALLQPARNACLILPPGADALALFAESLALSPAQAWQAAFTTILQPADDPGDFHWLAVEAFSPLRTNAENGRAILDLTAPHSLPIPAPPASAPIGPELFSPERPPGKLFAPAPIPPASVPRKRKNTFDDHLAATGTERPRRRTGLWLGIAAAVAAIAVGVFFFMARESDAIKSQRTQIRETFHGIFEDNTGAELAKLHADKLSIGTTLAAAAADTVAALRSPNLSPPSEQTKQASNQANASSVVVPSDVRNLFVLHGDLSEIAQRLKKIEQSEKNAEQFEELHQLYKRIGDIPKQPLQRLAPKLLEDMLDASETLWTKRFSEVIQSPPGERQPEWFRKQFDNLPGKYAKSVEGEKIAAIIADWQKLVALGEKRTEIQSLSKDKRHLWPAWLVTLADEKREKQKEVIVRPPDPPIPDKPKDVVSNPRFEGDLMIVLNPDNPEEWESFAAELKKSGAEPWLKTPRSEGNGIALKRQGDGFLFKITDPKKVFVWNEKSGDFSAGQAAPAPPYELRLRKDGKCLLTAWVTAADHAAPLRVVEKGGLQRNNERLQIKSSEALDLCEKARNLGPMVVLELPSSCSPQLPPEKHRIPVETSGSASLDGIVTALNNRIITEKKNHEDQQRIADGKSPKLVAALDPVNKVIEQENKERHEAAEKEAKHKKQPLVKVVETPVLTYPMKTKDFGNHLKSYGNSSEYENLFKVGENLLNLKANEPLPIVIPGAVEAADKAISRWGLRMGEGNNSKEKERLKNIYDQKIARLKELRELLVALQNEPELSKTAKRKAAESQRILDALNKHPLHKKDVLPTGEYRLLIQPSDRAPWLTLVLFKSP